MDFSKGLLAELAEYEAFTKWRAPEQPDVSTTEPTATELRTLRTLTREALRVSALTAGAGSIVNLAAQRIEFTSLCATLDHLCAGFSTAGYRAMEQLAQRARYGDLAAQWLEADSRHGFAIGLTRAWTHQSRQPTQPSSDNAARGLIALDAMADAWVRAGIALDALLDALSPYAERSQDVAASKALLRQVIDGKTPCIDREGCLSMPGWAERRREARTPIDVSVELVVQGRALRACANNVSRFGLGLTTDAHIPLGSPIEVRRTDGPTLRGIVRWTKTTGAGVALEAPMTDDDPWLPK